MALGIFIYLVRNLGITGISKIQIATLPVNLSILLFLPCSFRILLITCSLFGKQESHHEKDSESRQTKSIVSDPSTVAH